MRTLARMTTLSPEAVLENLNWRYATKKFDPTRTIDERTWHALEQAALLAPSCYGLQASRIVVVTNPDVRARLRGAAYGQPQITDCSHLVVFARKLAVTQADADALLHEITTQRGVPMEALAAFKGSLYHLTGPSGGFPGGSVDTWSRAQTYIALGFFLSAAANLGVDACPMEGFNPAAFDEILGLREDGYAASVIAAAGYRAADDPFASFKKVRLPTSMTLRRI